MENSNFEIIKISARQRTKKFAKETGDACVVTFRSNTKRRIGRDTRDDETLRAADFSVRRFRVNHSSPRFLSVAVDESRGAGNRNVSRPFFWRTRQRNGSRIIFADRSEPLSSERTDYFVISRDGRGRFSRSPTPAVFVRRFRNVFVVFDPFRRARYTTYTRPVSRNVPPRMTVLVSKKTRSSYLTVVELLRNTSVAVQSRTRLRTRPYSGGPDERFRHSTTTVVRSYRA